MTAGGPTTVRAARARRDRAGGVRARAARAWPWLALICAAQVALALRPGLNRAPFEDEGLYVYIGHRMIDHLLHGAVLHEYPGQYFSGAPGFYPVLAALGDAVGGLQGARMVSLAFALVATVGVHGLGDQLFGRAAGLLGALAFVLCGSVIYQSHLATFDSTMLGLVAVAAWLAVSSTRHDGLLWAPVVSLLLTLAFLAKYAGAAYAPVVAGLAVAVGWRTLRWAIVRRASFVLVGALVMGFFVIELWGQDLVRGIRTTTASRTVLSHASAAHLLGQGARWVGPWLALAALGGLLHLRRRPLLVLVLLGGAILGPAQQIRIGESISLNKHVAFGIVFAAPLVGELLARALRRAPVVAVPVVSALMGLLCALGLHFSGQFLTSWVQDDNLLPALQSAIAARPHKAILGEKPSPERYQLRTLVAPRQWTDTYSFRYAGMQDEPAYRRAIDESHFGVIYLSMVTPRGRYIQAYLATRRTPYRLATKVPRYLRGELVGWWLVYSPKALRAP